MEFLYVFPIPFFFLYSIRVDILFSHLVITNTCLVDGLPVDEPTLPTGLGKEFNVAILSDGMLSFCLFLVIKKRIYMIHLLMVMKP